MMTISTLAKAASIGVETVRYYQRRGLIAVPARPEKTGIRRYGTDDLTRLRFIRNAQSAGFTLEDIRKLMALDSTTERSSVRAMASERLAIIDQKLRELQTVRNALRQLAADCESGEAGPCPIIKAFEREQKP
jgi:MerR family transcriptional regulator, mercuric resistance operon regulatory protein